MTDLINTTGIITVRVTRLVRSLRILL